MTFKRNEEGDIHLDDLWTAIDLKLKECQPLPANYVIKWTCPKCGERVDADKPNVFHALGWHHTLKGDGSPCGGVYHGPYFGFAIIAGIRAETLTKIMDDIDHDIFAELFGSHT